jgi:hypothetical protein
MQRTSDEHIRNTKARMWLLAADHSIGNALAYLEGIERVEADSILARIRNLNEHVVKNRPEPSALAVRG